ncbi:unnamed protein product [Bursaphelenchus okinawaensis]|uniref:Uncharacterized protein n=1 Tax=Bursaphelenchus okinawaensis TaxID=465554 RepID=A0A811KTZ7_9BILA|nr:unnamed protein product [Bursaphelenchus okinawaensis]CAG9111746.1 unnamed protein product [Bursaphelenchus okinawaensis]
MASFARFAGRNMENAPRSARPYFPSSLCGDVESMMIDMVLTEIQNQIERIEDEQERKRQEALKESQSPDYTWLMDWKLKNKKVLNFRECSAVELLCQKIQPAEWSLLIRTFRTKARYVDSRDGVIDIFRHSVEEIIGQRGGNTSVLNVDEHDEIPEMVDEWGTAEEFVGGRAFSASRIAQKLQRNGKRRLTLQLGETVHYTRFY